MGILSRIGRRLGAAMETACALRAALAASGRERSGWLCGACRGGEYRVVEAVAAIIGDSIGDGGYEAAVEF